MTAAAADEGKEELKRRERGTLKDTLPRRPIVIIALVCAASAALATALFVYSYSSPLVVVAAADLAGFASVACLGAASTAVGMIFGDSLSHVFAFGVALLFLDHGSIASSVVAASPSLALAALVSIRGPRLIISSLDSGILLNTNTLQACCIIPVLALIHQSIVNPVFLNFSTNPICTVAFLTLLLMRAYNRNRGHKHGCLLTSEMKSQAVFACIAILLSCSIAVERIPHASIHMLVVFLLGSVFTLLMSCIFASVADVWYTVGSGQFQMVSLDTAGLLFFFICPAVILYLRFVEKYGESIAAKGVVLREYLQSAGLSSRGDVHDEDMASFSLVMTLAMITAIGVPLLNSLCPIGGFLFSRAYTHGQPNTKKVALCVNFSELPSDASKRKSVLDFFEKKKKEGQMTAVLNIFVTLEELFSLELKLLGDLGHAISLAPSEFHESICGLSMFKGNNSCNLDIAHHDYAELFGKNPTWFFAKSADSLGRHPSLLRGASDLGMKIAYWSTFVQLTDDETTRDLNIAAIKGECSEHNGGSIIYVTLKTGVSSKCMSYSLCEIVDALDDYTLASLSDVVRDDATMVL